MYKQLGLDRYVKTIKKKYVPEIVQKYGGWIIVGHDAYSKGEIKYVWEYKF